MRTTTAIVALLASACGRSPATDRNTDDSTDPCIKLIENGGFENKLDHWQSNVGVAVIKNEDDLLPCFAGDKCALIAQGQDEDGGPIIDGVLSQSAYVPVSGTTSLSFHARRTCPDVNRTLPGELQRARILNEAGDELQSIFSDCGDTSVNYPKTLVDLTKFAGQTITVEFSVSSFNDPATTMVVDEVQLENHPDDGRANACGLGSCFGNPECESCLNDGECADGPDPVWTGTGCACADFPAGNCDLPFCCAAGTHWDPKACEIGNLNCMPDGFANLCGVGDCHDDVECENCIGEVCDSGVPKVWTGTACVCPTTPQNCQLPYCCANGTHWDTTQCACIP